jgi:hypothetical protein
MNRKVLVYTVITFICGNLWGWQPSSNMLLEEPITDFSLPLFSENGYKCSDLRGREVYYVDPENVRIIDMILRTFSGEADENLIMTVRSPEAIVSVVHESDKATGNGFVFLYGPGYKGLGREWMWEGKKHEIFVKHDVHVIFDSSTMNKLL